MNERTKRPSQLLKNFGAAAPDQKDTARRGNVDTVTVACKLPHGLELRLYDMVDVSEPMRDGQRMVKMARQRIEAGVVILKGYNEHYDPQQPPISRSSSYALTTGVPKAFFEEWCKQNHDSDLLKNRLIFAHDEVESVQSMARENAATTCGLEPLDPSNLPKGISTFKKEAA